MPARTTRRMCAQPIVRATPGGCGWKLVNRRFKQNETAQTALDQLVRVFEKTIISPLGRSPANSVPPRPLLEDTFRTLTTPQPGRSIARDFRARHGVTGEVRGPGFRDAQGHPPADSLACRLEPAEMLRTLHESMFQEGTAYHTSDVTSSSLQYIGGDSSVVVVVMSCERARVA